MSKYSNAGGVFASVAIVAASVGSMANAFGAFFKGEISQVALLITVQAALAAAAFLPAVLSKLGDRETLSVYRAMRRAG